MKYDITKTNVSEVSLEERPESDANRISLSSCFFYDEKDKTNVKATMETTLSIAHQVEIKFKYNFFFKFEEEVIDEKLENFMDEINFHSMAYPYIRTYAINLLNMSGYYITNPPIIPEF